MSGRPLPWRPDMSAIALETSAGPLAAAGDVLAVPVAPGDDGRGVGVGADALTALGIDAPAVLASREASGSAGEVVEIPVARDGVMAVLLVGVGDRSPGALRKAGAAMARRSGSARTVA